MISSTFLNMYSTIGDVFIIIFTKWILKYPTYLKNYLLLFYLYLCVSTYTLDNINTICILNTQWNLVLHNFITGKMQYKFKYVTIKYSSRLFKCLGKIIKLLLKT